MSTYHDLIANAALRIGAFSATLPAAIQTAYATRPLVAGLFNSADFPFDAILEAAVSTEFTIAQIAASVKKHPWRGWLLSQTGTLVNQADIPDKDSSNIPIVGIWSGVFDATDRTECLPRTVDYVTRRARNAGSWAVIPDYSYNAETDRLLHTRTLVRVKCCVYNRVAQKAAIETDGTVLIQSVPDELFIAGMVSTLSRDDAFAEQAKAARGYFETGLQASLALAA